MADQALYTIKITGLREYLQAAKDAGPDVDKMMRTGLRDAVQPALFRTQALVSQIDASSATGWGTAIRKTGVVAMEQRFPRTTGKHPEFGRAQKRRALRAFEETRPLVIANMQRELDKVTKKFPGVM